MAPARGLPQQGRARGQALDRLARLRQVLRTPASSRRACARSLRHRSASDARLAGNLAGTNQQSSRGSSVEFPEEYPLWFNDDMAHASYLDVTVFYSQRD